MSFVYEPVLVFPSGSFYTVAKVDLGLTDIDGEFYQVMDVVQGFIEGVQLHQWMWPYHKYLVYISTKQLVQVSVC